MPKQLNEIGVTLSFNADTRKAKQEIDSLQQALQNVAKLPGKASTLFGDKEIKAASEAALELQTHLQKAFNTNTGKLDLSRLSTSLKASGQSLDQYYDKLAKAGAVGQDAFLKVARSVATAEAPVTRVNARLEEMLATLKNTARWQISSSILHGFMGTVQEAYHYAQDLNESLNNIRIVTGQSTDQMAEFAKRANESAKALSTTTTEYTDAALIFYQQGLNDEQVKERTDVTIKMANVSRQSAEEVSDQMTAVWNNFNKAGDESAEHFADVMTKLGAETASSSSEIATGLEKFAGIADTIGLSFDYASSALATITATSRETPEVVGTALKTIFARIQGLKLGETLEDGTDLNKYSEGLAKVGISIKDTTGEMKNADVIIDEMGAKWKQLTKDQQMALAQTVAGTRQYNQLMTLMANFDFFKENVDRARSAEGSLQAQADIYAESWEAARDRVQAAAEDIYTDLFNDDFFIGITNGLAKILEVINGITEGFGGLKGIVATVGSLFLTYYANKVPDALNNLRQNLMVITGQSTKVMQEMQAENAKALVNVQNNPNLSLSYKTQAEGIARVNEMQQKLVLYNKQLTTSEQEAYKLRIQNVQAMSEEAVGIAQVVEKLNEEVEAQRKQIASKTEGSLNTIINDYNEKEKQASYLEKKIDTEGDPTKQAAYASALEKVKIEAAEAEAKIDAYRESLQLSNSVVITEVEGQEKVKEKLTEVTTKFEDYHQQYKKLESISATGKGKAKQWEEEAKAIGEDTNRLQALKNEMLSYIETVRSENTDIRDLDKKGGWKNGKRGEYFTGLIEDIKNLDNTNIDEVFSKFQSIFDFKNQFNTLSKDIDSTRNILSAFLSPEDLAEFDRLVDIAKAKMVELEDVKENLDKEGALNPLDMRDNTSINFEQVTMGLTQFGSAAMATYSAIQSIVNGFSILQDVVEGNASALEGLGAIVTILMTSTQALNSITALNTTLTSSNIVAKIAELAATKALEAGNIGLATSIFMVEGALAPVLIAMLALAAVIGVVVGVVYGLSKAFEAAYEASPEGRLESSTKEVEKLSSAYENLSQKVSDVKNEFEQYDEARKVLSEMKTGTEEWTEAVLKLNEQVITLIDKYPELAEGLTITNGIMSINEDTMKEYIKTLQQQQTAIGLMRTQEQSNQTQAQIEVDRKANSQNRLPETTAGNLMSVAGVISNFGGGPSFSGADYQQEQYNKILDGILKEGSGILSDSEKLKEATGISSELANKIARSEQIQAQLAQDVVKEQTERLKIENQQKAAVSQYLSANVDNKNYQKLISSNKQEDQDLLNIINNSILENTKEGSQAFEKARENLEDKSKKEIEKLWAKANDYKLNDEGDYVDKSGQKVDFDKDEAIKQLAQIQAAEKQTEQDFDKLIQNIRNNLGAFNKEYKNGLIGFLTSGTADDFTKAQSERLKGIEDPDELLRTLGLNKEKIQLYGYNSAEEFKKAFEDAINSSEANLDTYFNSLSTQVKTKIEQLKNDGRFEGLTNQQQTQIGKSLESADDTSVTALNSLSGILDDKTTNITKFTDAINNTDWSSVKNIKDVTDSLAKSGGISEDRIESVRAYAREMTLAAQATEQTKHSIDDADVTENKEQWEGLSSALQGLAREGRGVDKELADNKEAADEAAAEILRYDHAVEEVTKNYDEWMSQLSSDNIMDNAEAIGELRDIYGDLLDIDPSSLSEGFISSTENLELMRQAAEGSEEAYNRLQELAQQDMEAQLHIGIDDIDFWNAKAQIQTALDEMNFQDLEVGANLDIGNFLDSLSTMVNAAGMTQQQATDYLSSMGIDAEVQTTEVPTTVKKTFTGVEYDATPVTASGTLPIIGLPYEMSVPQLKPIIRQESVDEVQSTAAHALKVTSANKSSGGNFKFSNSSHGGGSAGQKARSSGGGGKGGGGGSSKQPKQPQHKDHKDPLKEIADRYHDLNKAIQDVEHSMSMLSKTQDHLVGSALAKSLKEQNKLLEQQKGNYQALNNELRKEQGELQWILSFAGGSFGADGSILNYTDVFNRIRDDYNNEVARYNSTIDWYNSLSGEEQDEMGKNGVEFAEKVLEAAKKNYDEANKYLSRYDEVYNELQKNDEKLKELLYQQIENNLKAFEVEINVKLDISEAQRKVNDFLRDIRKNFRTLYTETEDWTELFTTAMKDAYSLASAEGTINTRLREIQEIRSVIDNPNYNYNSGMSLFVDRSEAIEKLKEYTEELMTESEDLYNLYEDSWNSYLDAMDEALDQWDDILEGFEDINDTLDHYEKVTEMLYGGEDTAAGRRLLEGLYDMSATNSLGAQTALRKELDSLNKELSELYARGAKDGEQDIEKLKDAIKEKTHELESEQEYFLEVIQNRLINSIKTIIDTADKALTRGFGGNKIIERWNDAKEAAEGYYDEIERVYQLENLESKWEKAINDASTIKNQQYLKTLMDNQLSNLRSKTKLSEYNITLAEKELAIYQAQMALEDARNNKNTMKLVRNEQGDWTYQYVADEEDVNAKEEELLNAMYDKYEYVKQSSADATEAILDLYNTANEKLSELMQEYTNADEERRAELAEEYDYWYNYYWGENGLIVQKVAEAQEMETDLQIAGMETLWQLYEQDKDNFDIMTTVEKGLITELQKHGVDSLETLELERDDFYTSTKQQTKDVIKETRTQWENMATNIIGQWNKNPDSVRANIQSAYSQIMTKVDEYDKAILKSEFISGTAWADVEGQLSRVGDKIQDNIYKIDDMTNKTDQLSTFREYVDLIGMSWYNVKGAIEETTAALDRYLRMLAGEDTSGGGGSPAPDAGPVDNGGGNAGGGGELSAEEWAVLGETVALGIAQNIYTHGTWGNDPVRHDRITERYGEEMANRVQEIINEYIWSGREDELINPDSRIWGYATGGYTGDWNGEGRVALLHQKELVLNEKDTENILDAVNIVRTIKDSIGSMVSSITNLAPESIAAASNVNNSDKKVFNITAEFPNANNVTEIQEAILGLPNLASQWMSANG